MKAAEALALTQKSQLEITEKLKELFPPFLKQTLKYVEKEAKRGYKSAHMEYSRLWDEDELVHDDETDSLEPKYTSLKGFDARVMRDMLTTHLRVLGYKVTKDGVNNRISWGEET